MFKRNLKQKTIAKTANQPIGIIHDSLALKRKRAWLILPGTERQSNS